MVASKNRQHNNLTGKSNNSSTTDFWLLNYLHLGCRLDPSAKICCLYLNWPIRSIKTYENIPTTINVTCELPKAFVEVKIDKNEQSTVVLALDLIAQFSLNYPIKIISIFCARKKSLNCHENSWINFALCVDIIFFSSLKQTLL